MRTLFLLLFLFGTVPAWAANPETGDYSTTPSTDRTLNSDASPSTVPGEYPDQPNFPKTGYPQSSGVRPYQIPKHRYLSGSEFHPNPSQVDTSFAVNEDKKTVRVTDTQQLYAYKDWAQERFFDVKFETINKRFTAIEIKQAELDKRLAELEK